LAIAYWASRLQFESQVVFDKNKKIKPLHLKTSQFYLCMSASGTSCLAMMLQDPEHAIATTFLSFHAC